MNLLKLSAALLLIAAWPVRSHAETPLNEVPLYRGREKTDAEKKLDATFISEAVKAAGSKEAAAAQLLKRGWQAIAANDAKGAIRRFNQASLLSSDNAEVFWGLGSAEGQLGHCDSSIKLFEEAAKLASSNSRLIADFGYAHTTCAIGLRNDSSIPHFIEAEKLYHQSIKLDPKSALPYSRLAVLMFYKGDMPETERFVAKSKSLGGEGLDPRFLQDLASRR